MQLPAWLQHVLEFSLTLTEWQRLGLAFLLGSFAVATLSDLKRLSAQQEFVEIWLLFLLAALGIEVYDAYHGRLEPEYVAVKWGLIVLLSILSFRPVGVLFRLAGGDVAALAAAASLLSPVLIAIYYAVARLLALFLRPLLGRGNRPWPFMPVVSLATLVVLLLGWILQTLRS